MKRPDACAATDHPHRRITLSGWPATVQDLVSFLLGTSGLFLLSWGEGVEAVILLAALVPFFFGMDTYLYRRTRASTEGLSSRLANRRL